MAKTKQRYRALVGLSWDDVRLEAGEVSADIPRRSLDWLLEQGLIEAVEEEVSEDADAG